MYKKKISVVFPIYNEEKTIEKTLNEWILELQKITSSFEIILAEDGSIDNTKEVLHKLLKNDKNKIFVNNIKKEKRGYALAILESFNLANGEYIFCVDSDGQCSPLDFSKFWNKIHENYYDIVIGYRQPRRDSYFRIIISKFFFILHRVLFYSKIKDPSCPYIIFKKNIISKLYKDLHYMTEGFWWGFIGSATKNELKIDQIKINHYSRDVGDTNVFILKKIPLIAIKNIIGLLKIRLIN